MMEQLMQQQEQIKEMQQSIERKNDLLKRMQDDIDTGKINDIQIQRDYQTDIELVMLLNKDS